MTTMRTYLLATVALLLGTAEFAMAQEPAPAPAPRRATTRSVTRPVAEPAAEQPSTPTLPAPRTAPATKPAVEERKPALGETPPQAIQDPNAAPAPAGGRRVVQSSGSDNTTYTAPAPRRAAYPAYENRKTAELTERERKEISNSRSRSPKDSGQRLAGDWQVPLTDWDKIVIPEDSLPSEYEERLVQTAWRNLPTNRVAEARVKQAGEMHLQARRSWYTDIVLFAQTNFTDYGAGVGSRPTVSAVPSGLGAGLSFNLGQFVNYGSRVRHTRQSVVVAQEDLNYQKHFMRSETIKRYQSFLMYRNLVKSQMELANEQEMTLKVMKLNFETGQVPVEEFAKIQKAYADAAQLVVTSKHNMFSAKAYLEEWIGVKLEEVR